MDGDFYTSVRESLEHVYPRLSKGAVVVVDDYCDPAVNPVYESLPGVKRACDDFLTRQARDDGRPPRRERRPRVLPEALKTTNARVARATRALSELSPATTYSPTPLPVQYHRPWRA